MTASMPSMLAGPEAPAAARVGRIHSVETCGTLDGPGLRYVVFTQGCPLRCRYCHNPDTWEPAGGREVSVGTLVREALAYRVYMESSGGGITVSGGEPLLQPHFVAGLLAECRRAGLHTALDTSGHAPLERARPVLAQTDLLLLDLKQLHPDRHRALTGVGNRQVLDLARLADSLGVPIWVRYVVVPGWTDSPDDVAALADFVGTLAAVEKVELLPYHLLGRHKWERLGLTYPLEGVAPPTPAVMDRVREQLAGRGLAVE